MTTQSKDIPIASPVLSYATHDADGTPDWVPEAEVRIEAGDRPNAIRDLFRKPLHAARYFGKSMSRRHGYATLGDRCVNCGASPSSFAVAITWFAIVRPRTLQFSMRGEETAKFETMHSLCTDCVEPWMARLSKIGIRRKRLRIARTTMVVVWLVGLFAIRAIVRTYFNRRTSMEYWLPGIWIAFVCVGLVLQFIDYTFRRGVPRYLRKLMPRDVRFGGLTGAFHRVDGQLQSLW